MELPKKLKLNFTHRSIKTRAKSVEECATLFEIEVPRETIDQAFEEVYEEITKVANIPGFRVGRAPKELVKKHYADNARGEVLKRVIPDAYRSALAEHRIDTIGTPEISELVFEEGKPLSFKAKIETRPIFKLKNYKGIKINKKKSLVKEEDVDKTLQNLRELNAKYIAVEERPAQLGDYVVTDLECFFDGKPVYKKRENLWLHMDKESLMGELCEKMVGTKKLEEKDFEVSLPEKYPDKNLAGKIVKYHVKVKEIRQRNLPELNDEFAKDLGKESLNQLRENLTGELKRRSELKIETDMENQILNKLMDDNSFQVPTSLVKRQIEFMVENAKARLEEKGFKREDLDKKKDEFIERFKDDAVRQVRLLFVLAEIAKRENITADDEETEEALQEIAGRTNHTIAKVKEYYERKGLREDLKEKLREDKTIRFLLDSANVIEEG